MDATCQLPSFDQFCRHAEHADYVPVFRELLADSLTPVQAFSRLPHGVAAGLFESVIGGEKIGRYSFVACDPFWFLEAHGQEATIRRRDHAADAAAATPGAANSLWSGWSTQKLTVENPLEVLRQQVQSIRVAHLPELPPFIGGAVGYAGYDAVRYFERLPNAPPDDRGLADLAFGLFDHMVVFDNVRKTLHVIVLADVRGGVAGQDLWRQRYEEAAARVDGLIAALNRPDDGLALADLEHGPPRLLATRSTFTQPEFAQQVARCVEYIRAGDIFQVVIGQRLQTPFAAPPLELYRTLRVVNPSPFMFFLQLPECTLVGSSPEIMVRVVDGEITVRPLAGTRRRGRDDDEDRRLAEELLADPKERAEHVMLVDLGRNDVGRVSRFGSVELSDVMVIERYSHVMHITSNVTGQLRDDCDCFDALAACLPAGTVSGAPKVRAMEIIDEVEPCRRGPYAGAVGYIDFAGNMDTCIALRTVVIQDQTASVQVSAGIVADSVPELEWQETLSKARGMLTAIELTQRRLG